MIITSDYGSFPHSLLSTSKPKYQVIDDVFSYFLDVTAMRLGRWTNTWCNSCNPPSNVRSASCLASRPLGPSGVALRSVLKACVRSWEDRKIA